MRLRRHDAPRLGAGAQPGGRSISAGRSRSTSGGPLSSRTGCVTPGSRAALPCGDCGAGQAWSRAECDRSHRRRRGGNGGVAATSLPAPVHRMPRPPVGPEPDSGSATSVPWGARLCRHRCAAAGAVLRNIGRPAGECASSQADGTVRVRGPGGDASRTAAACDPACAGMDPVRYLDWPPAPGRTVPVPAGGSACDSPSTHSVLSESTA
jgi:hypothetical protein